MNFPDPLFPSSGTPNEIEGNVSQIGFVPSWSTDHVGHFVVRLEDHDRVFRFSCAIPRDMVEELALGQRGDTLKLRFAGDLEQDFVEPVFLTVRPPVEVPYVPNDVPGIQLC